MAGESIRQMLAREAAEAEVVADAEDRGERAPAPGQRARRQAGDASQVYSVRIPVERLTQLRAVADEKGLAPTVLLRQFVLERLDRETATAPVPLVQPGRDLDELRLGPSRRRDLAEVLPIAAGRSR